MTEKWSFYDRSSIEKRSKNEVLDNVFSIGLFRSGYFMNVLL